jgi:hypothetical protein
MMLQTQTPKNGAVQWRGASLSREVVTLVDRLRAVLEMDDTVRDGRVMRTAFELAFEDGEDSIIEYTLELLLLNGILKNQGISQGGYRGQVWSISSSELMAYARHLQTLTIPEEVEVVTVTETVSEYDIYAEMSELEARLATLRRLASEREELEGKMVNVQAIMVALREELDEQEREMDGLRSQYRELTGSDTLREVNRPVVTREIVQVTPESESTDDNSSGSDIQISSKTSDATGRARVPFVLDSRVIEVFRGHKEVSISPSNLSDRVLAEAGYKSRKALFSQLSGLFSEHLSLSRCIGLTKKSGDRRERVYSISARMLKRITDDEVMSAMRAGTSSEFSTSRLKTMVEFLRYHFEGRLTARYVRSDMGELVHGTVYHSADQLWADFTRYEGCYYAGRRLSLEQGEDPAFYLE